MKVQTLIASAALVAFGSIAVAQSDEEVDPAVTARHAHMQLYSHYLGIIGGMAQQKIEYDADIAQVAATNLTALAALQQTTYWPEGTSEGTNALPTIWDNMDDFIAKRERLVNASAAMAELAGVDLASLQSGMGDLGGACSACHREYRQRDD